MAVANSVTGLDGWTKSVDLTMIATQARLTLRRYTSWPKLAEQQSPSLTNLSPFLAPISMQKRNYTCKPCGPCDPCKPCGPCCLPPPCNTPPRCVQYMTGYYNYPYGTWFCGPYHQAKICAISTGCCKGCCCCAACLAAQGFSAAGMGSASTTANYSQAATWSNQANQMAYAAMARPNQAQAEPAATAEAEEAEAATQKPEIPVELPSKPETAEKEKPKPPESTPPVKPLPFSRFYPFP